MLRIKLLTFIAVVVTSQMTVVSDAQAGPLLDWLRGIRRNDARPVLPQYGFSAAAATNPNVANLQPGQCLRTCQQTCSRTVVNYVPYTAYRTNWNRVPVTQYRPVTSSDPCTGCTVTCMKPCTTYTYKMQRVPYTTYRPVYRQETYRVPVTTLVDNCSTGTCDTCGPGNFGPAQNFAPPTPNSTPNQNFSAPVFSPQEQGSVPADTVPSLSPTPAGSASRATVPSGTLSTASNYQLQSAYQPGPSFDSAPAATVAAPHTAARVPDVNSATRGVRPQSSQRPFLHRLQDQGSHKDFNNSSNKQAVTTPRQIKPKTQLTALHRRWSYSPVRLASNRADASVSRSPFSSVETRREINSAWDDVK